MRVKGSSMRDYNNDSDFESVQRAKAGSSGDLYLLFIKYENKLFHYCMCLADNKLSETDVLIIMSEVLEKLPNSISKFREQSSFKTFLYTIVRNTTFSFLRKHKNDPIIVSLDAGIGIPGPSIPNESALKVERVQRLLNQLKPAGKEVLVLYYYEDLTDGEIAKIIGKSKDAAKKMRQRVEKELGNLYDKEKPKGRLHYVIEEIKKRKNK
jgi:RNA polymerase sigma-70 factor (ECF subfamily)